MTEIEHRLFDPGRMRACLPVLLAALLVATGTGQSGSGLGLPGGYDSVQYFAGFAAPVTALTLDAQNRVFATTIDGEIRVLVDANQDGVAESSTIFYANPTNQLYSVTDILWIGAKLYVCHQGKVTTLEDTNADDVADVATDIVTGIPVGFHQNNGLLVDGPSHFLVTNGSGSDLGPDPDPMNAAVLRAELSGANLTIHATGIRNCFRLARHPVTGDVFGGDNEWNNHPTQSLAGDEVNRILAGADYGFPNFFGTPPAGSSAIGPAVILPPRVAPTGLAFNPNLRISGYQNELYMTLFAQGGSAVLARVPIWYGPVSGTPLGLAEVFATGFINPIDVEFLPDGSILVADFSAANIHRIFPLHDATITILTPPCIGTYVPIRLSSPSHPGAIVYMGASEAPMPSLPLGGSLMVYLDLQSPIFAISVTPGNGFFNFPVPGNLSTSGEYFAGIFIPPIPILEGFDVWLSYVVLDQNNYSVLATSPQQALRVAPLF